MHLCGPIIQANVGLRISLLKRRHSPNKFVTRESTLAVHFNESGNRLLVGAYCIIRSLRMLKLALSVSRCRTFVLGALICIPSIVSDTPSLAQTASATTETHAKGDITGSWQGTIHANKDLRQVLQISK